MRLGRYLTSLTKPELENLKNNLNMTAKQWLPNGQTRILTFKPILEETLTIYRLTKKNSK